MITTKNKGKTSKYVYDISLDGTVVNALGLNVVSNTDGFNFKLPDTFRYTEDNPYISPGLSRETKKGKAYTGYEADVAEFNDTYMCDMHYSDNAVNKMGLGIDEIVSATINFSRKNYADYFPDKPYPEDVKMVGNTIKSKKMPEYIEKFLDKGIRLLLNNDGQGFLNEYYDYVDKIYSYGIPLKEIASRGKVKKNLQEYVEDCQTITKAGRPKSRQAWMELAIKDGIDVNLGETLFYINTGKSKSQSDVKKVTHYYMNGGLFGDKMDCRVALEKEWKAAPKTKTVEDVEALGHKWGEPKLPLRPRLSLMQCFFLVIWLIQKRMCSVRMFQEWSITFRSTSASSTTESNRFSCASQRKSGTRFSSTTLLIDHTLPRTSQSFQVESRTTRETRTPLNS